MCVRLWMSRSRAIEGARPAVSRKLEARVPSGAEKSTRPIDFSRWFRTSAERYGSFQVVDALTRCKVPRRASHGVNTKET